MTVMQTTTMQAAEMKAVAIAPVSQALTFARTLVDGQASLYLVSGYQNGTVTGLNLTTELGPDVDDPVTAYGKFGYDVLAAMAGKTRVETLPVSDLVMPVGLTASHIAVGTNFPEHAEESTVTDGPFLFPKEVVPTPFNAPVSAGTALLDYEVELCFVALDDVNLNEDVSRMGLVLCNDVTDRAALLRNVDPFNVTSGKGFTTGKSAPGYMPIGNLFVIPKDVRSFGESIELRLYRNGELKQAARQSEAIWDFDELLRQSKARAGATWDYRGQSVALPVDNDIIPARTAILAGTPNGTIVQGINKSAYVWGVIDFLLGGWGKPVTYWVVERHIAQEEAKKNYLQPGEEVSVKVDYLGEMITPIVE
ncbi:MAG: hypothetical protein GC184_06330 [Rhizobiales bacterium]|nr:hypothetical protein [Hyphomicrobiales bacterium]